MKLCDKISKLRKRKGLSQEDLANELDVSRQSVFKWECGENTPDLEKIKKISKVFNVSFDLLLDDEKDIDDEQLKVVEKTNHETVNINKPVKFRQTFDSGIKLNSGNQADYEHGYSGKRKIDGYSFSNNSAKHEELISKKSYSKTVRVQHDILVDFFVDEKTKTFGFFFDCAPQFVCPFESLASFTISNSGVHTGYTRSPMVGVGIGSTLSVGVGSMPLGQTRQPLNYDLSISYFGEDGYLHDYKISFGCNHMYIICDGTVKSVDELYLWENMLSQSTNKSLNEISTYLNGIKESGQLLRQDSSSLPFVDHSALLNEVRLGQDKKRAINVNYNNAIIAHQKKKKKGWLIALIVALVITLGTITAVSVSKRIEQDQIAETNRNKAQEVIDMIDNLGTITLSSESAINRAENAYNALTSEQKALVTNYYKLTSARSTYEHLLYEQREEETKNDPTRTIALSDLNGRWESSTQEWAIADLYGGKSVLYWISGKINPTIITETLPSSSLKGYNNKTRRMEVKIYHYNDLGGEYIDVTMTKSSTGVLTLYFGSRTFHKK